MEEYPDISQVIIDNFIEVLNHIPMKRSDYKRIHKLLDVCINRLGKTITADAIYPYEDSDPYEYDSDYESEAEFYEEI